MKTFIPESSPYWKLGDDGVPVPATLDDIGHGDPGWVAVDNIEGSISAGIYTRFSEVRTIRAHESIPLVFSTHVIVGAKDRYAAKEFWRFNEYDDDRYSFSRADAIETHAKVVFELKNKIIEAEKSVVDAENNRSAVVENECLWRRVVLDRLDYISDRLDAMDGNKEDS
jgi:hypothetical protein